MQKFKYPRTPHCLWSDGADDKKVESHDHFIGKDVIISIKYDGENTTIGKGYCHARSLDSKNHPSRNWVKQFAGGLYHLIPENLRICGENLYARHSVEYNNLLSYFYGFSVWEGDYCYSWEDTLEIFDALKITCVKVLYDGVFDEDMLVQLIETLDNKAQEGLVIRNADGFKYSEFGDNVMKYVRPNHVQTSDHWMAEKIVPNILL